MEYAFDAGIALVATPVTLAECVAGAPVADVRAYVEFLTRSPEITFVPLDAATSLVAGQLRQETRLKLPDCLQIATAIVQGCDVLLTNDLELARRQGAIRTLMIADLDV